MRSIPRPLLILVVVIIVLGVISCGAAGIKGEPNPSEAAWDFTPDGIPIDEVREGAGCEVTDNVIKITSVCTLTIDAQPFPPRELRLSVIQGTPRVSIKMRGVPEPQATTFEDGDEFGVSAAVGEKAIEIDVRCTPIALPTPCALEVVDT